MNNVKGKTGPSGPGYRVHAVCTNTRCDTEAFTKVRRTVTRISQAEQEYTITRLVCPVCGMWGDITRIETEGSSREDAA